MSLVKFGIKLSSFPTANVVIFHCFKDFLNAFKFRTIEFKNGHHYSMFRND